jgi:cobalamin biosynthesis Co2+ chelatase CbiK
MEDEKETELNSEELYNKCVEKIKDIMIELHDKKACLLEAHNSLEYLQFEVNQLEGELEYLKENKLDEVGENYYTNR